MVDSVVLTEDKLVDVLLVKLVESVLVDNVVVEFCSTVTVVWIVLFDKVELFGTVEVVVTVDLGFVVRAVVVGFVGAVVVCGRFFPPWNFNSVHSSFTVLLFPSLHTLNDKRIKFPAYRSCHGILSGCELHYDKQETLIHSWSPTWDQVRHKIAEFFYSVFLHMKILTLFLELFNTICPLKGYA